MNSDNLSIVIDRPDGTQVRWADDETSAQNVPADLSFGTSTPGGFKGLSCNLARDLKVTGKEGLFDNVRVLGPGGSVRWEGRLQQMPASTDSGGRITPQAVGWQAHLDDDGTAREIYVDRDLANWGAPPAAREQVIYGASYKPMSGATKWDDSSTSAGPVLDLSIPGYAWSSNIGRPYCSLAYAAGGIELGGLEYRHRLPAINDPNWSAQIVAWLDLSATALALSAPLTGNTVSDGQLRTFSSPAGTKSLTTELAYQLAPAGNANDTYRLTLAEVAVYGRHGLVGPRGRSYTGAGQGPRGFYASDVIANAVGRWAPQLRFTTGPNGSIQPSDFAIPHLVFREHTTATEIVERCNAFHQWDWGVWENRTFTWGPRGSGRTWRIATADGLDLSLEGDTTDRISTGVVVTYTDYAGVQRSVGPTGSTAETTDPQLLVTDPSNPAVAHGLRRWSILSLSVPSDPAAATAIGRSWLEVQALASRRGQATVTGWVTDEAGAMRPVSEIRAGDTLVVTDRPDDPPRRIIETNFSYGPRSNQLTLDSTAATLDAVLERLGAALVGQV